jgi:uncharacterized repeat protein (TIGR03803 family)
MPFLATLALAAALAHGQTYIDLHDFGATSTDGKNLYGGVTIDANGNVYGTASGGGLYGGGTVWEITAAGLYKDLHDFGSGTDGITPRGVTFDRAGNLFGTTSGGGLRGPNDLEKGYGTIWEITNKGIYEPVYEFQGAAKDDGQNPFAGVTFDGVGNMYGTTTFGGPPGQFSAQIGFGIVWEITTAGVYKVLHDFGNGTDGQYPWAGVTFDAAGNMFGATSAGGFKDIGMIWEITNKGVYNDVYEFGTGGAGGQNPQADVTLDAAGNMYGTASQGGAVFETSPGFGDVWELTKAGVYKVLHVFGSGTDGQIPQAGVTLDAAGDMYGTTSEGGGNGYESGGTGDGIVWEITKAGAYKDIHDFGKGTDGRFTYAGLALDAGGNLYGTTVDGGLHGTENGGGIVWVIARAALTEVTVSPSAVTGGTSSSCTVTISGPAPAGGFTLELSSSSPSAGVPGSVTIPAGKTSVTFPITTKPVAANTSATITIKAGSVSKTAALTIDAPVLTSVTLSPSAVTGGNSSTGTVTLTGPAPSSGVVVTLSSSSKDATVPGSVTIASGKTTVTFTVKTTSVKSSTTATITVKNGSVTKTATLTIKS